MNNGKQMNRYTPHHTVDYNKLNNVGKISAGEMLHNLRKLGA